MDSTAASIFTPAANDTSLFALARGGALAPSDNDFSVMADQLQFYLKVTGDAFSATDRPTMGVFVDGKKIAEHRITASRRAGETEELRFSLAPGQDASQLQIRLLNDRFAPAANGQPARDNNLFIEEAKVNGVAFDKQATGWLRRDGRVWGTGSYAIRFDLPLLAGLANDTGSSATDGITRDATVQGQVAAGGARLLARLDGDEVDVTRLVDARGDFTLKPADLALLRQDGRLPDGSYQLALRSVDADGKTLKRTTVAFQLDTTAPGQPRFVLDPHDDAAPIGDSRTGKDTVGLIGQGEAGSLLAVHGQNITGTVGDKGGFSLGGIRLNPGENRVMLTATDLAGNASTWERTIDCIPGLQPDVVLQWNAVALNAVRDAGSPPPVVARNLALVHLAMLDAVRQAGEVKPEIAAAAAASTVLGALYTAQAETFLGILTGTVAGQDTPETRAALQTGLDAAKAVLDRHAGDGADQAVIPYQATGLPGNWAPLPGQKPLLPGWGQVKPFVVPEGAFAPPGNWPMDSAEYARDFNEVKSLGAKNSTIRTVDQTQIALFWSDGANTFTPPGHWNQIAQVVAGREGGSLLQKAETFALLNVAMSDAAIACWDTKYSNAMWRPIMAIRNADKDGNPQTVADRTWESLIPTPPHPDYTSGHSTFSGAASTILTALYAKADFQTESLGLPGIMRGFTSFGAAANEAGRSRIFGGIHVQKSNQDGLDCGRQVADYILKHRQAIA